MQIVTRTPDQDIPMKPFDPREQAVAPRDSIERAVRDAQQARDAFTKATGIPVDEYGFLHPEREETQYDVLIGVEAESVMSTREATRAVRAVGVLAANAPDLDIRLYATPWLRAGASKCILAVRGGKWYVNDGYRSRSQFAQRIDEQAQGEEVQ